MRPAARAAARALAGALGGLAGLAALLALVAVGPEPLPPVLPEPGTAFFDTLRDTRPTQVQVTEAWEKIALVVEAEDLLRDPTLWNRMHFEDWDRIPEPLRSHGLENMIARYRATTTGPGVWRTMTAEDWDAVPQPVRAMAFIGIAEYWVRHRGIGLSAGLPVEETADTLAAILMVESWFDHRAVHRDAQGQRDLGLPQASEYCRLRLAALQRARQIDLRLEERDYFNPWLAILAGAIWLDLMLDEAHGDLDLAVRAYRKGIEAARQGAAAEYLTNLKRKRERYIHNHGAPPTWDLLSRRLRRRFDAVPLEARRPHRRTGRGGVPERSIARRGTAC